MEIRAWFINIFGEVFSKDFENYETFNFFVEDATKVETKLTSFVSIDARR